MPPKKAPAAATSPGKVVEVPVHLSHIEKNVEYQAHLRAQMEKDPNVIVAAVDMAKNAMSGNLPRLTQLLDMGVPVDMPDKFGWSALMRACYMNQPTAAELLLSRGAFVNHINLVGENAAHWACERGFPLCLDVLMEWGVDLTALDEKSVSPMDRINALAAVNKKTAQLLLQVVQKFEDQGVIITEEGLRKLDSIAGGKENNLWAAYVEDGSRQTLLHLAARKGHLKATERIVAVCKSINIFAQDKKGRTAADIAREYKHPEIERVIKEGMDQRMKLSSSIGTSHMHGKIENEKPVPDPRKYGLQPSPTKPSPQKK